MKALYDHFDTEKAYEKFIMWFKIFPTNNIMLIRYNLVKVRER